MWNFILGKLIIKDQKKLFGDIPRFKKVFMILLGFQVFKVCGVDLKSMGFCNGRVIYKFLFYFNKSDLQ